MIVLVSVASPEMLICRLRSSIPPMGLMVCSFAHPGAP